LTQLVKYVAAAESVELSMGRCASARLGSAGPQSRRAAGDDGNDAIARSGGAVARVE